MTKYKEYMATWRKEHKAHISEYNKNYKKEHPDKVKQWNKKYYETHKQAHKEYKKKYTEENREAIYDYNRKWVRKNRDKTRAQTRKWRATTNNASSKVENAIQARKIHKQPCEVCGEIKAEAHHDDYNKPLEVRWLCRKHHSEWHKNNKPIVWVRTE